MKLPKIRFDKFFSWLWSLIKPRAPKPPVVEPPVVVETEKPQPSTIIILPPPFCAGYFEDGTRWRAWAKAYLEMKEWPHGQLRDFTNVLRLGAWDNEPSSDTTPEQMLADSRMILAEIMADPAETRGLLVVTNYVPGQTTDAELDAQLRVYAPYWSRVVAVETVDEWGKPEATNQTAESAIATREHFFARMYACGLDRRPLFAAASGEPERLRQTCQMCDLVGIEFYRPHPYTASAEEVEADCARQLDQVRAQGREAVTVQEAYYHNGECSPESVPPIVRAGTLWAKRNNLRGIVFFSYARMSGFSEPKMADTLAQVRRGAYIFLGRGDPGPSVPEPPAPEPPPAPNPGKIQPNSKVVFMPAGSKSVTLKVVRLGGTLGRVTCVWDTYSGTGYNGTEYAGGTGTLVFGDGQDATTLTIQLLDTPLEGTWEAWVRLSYPTGGAEIADAKMRFGCWGKGSVVGFLYPTIKGTRGNNTTIKVRREGAAEDLNTTTRVKIESVSGGFLGTAVEGVNYRALDGQWLTFAPGVREQTTQMQLLAGGPDVWLTLRVVKVEPEGGAYSVSPTTGVARLECH